MFEMKHLEGKTQITARSPFEDNTIDAKVAPGAYDTSRKSGPS